MLLILRQKLLGNGNRSLLPCSHRRDVARSSGVPSQLNQKSRNAFRGIVQERSATPADGMRTQFPALNTSSGQRTRQLLRPRPRQFKLSRARPPQPRPLERLHIRRPLVRPGRGRRRHIRRPQARRHMRPPRPRPLAWPRPRKRTRKQAWKTTGHAATAA